MRRDGPGRETGGREDEYRDLVARHREFEARLSELSRKPWLSPEERLESTKLKKLKLRLKDRMAALRRGPDPLPGG